jgi:Xaa-Pro dipeptidase
MMQATDGNTALAKAIRAKVFDAGAVDVLVSTDLNHVGYLSGYRSILFDAIRHYSAAVVATRDKAIIVTGASDGAAALEAMQDPALVYRHGNFYMAASEPGVGCDAMPPAAGSFFEAIAAALSTIARPGDIIGIDAADEWTKQCLADLAAPRQTASAQAAIAKSRAVKLPAEIERLRIASHITETGMILAMSGAGEGMTELDISSVISAEIVRGGGIPRFMVVTTGLRSAFVDAYATSNKLRNGDLVRLDLGASFGGYWSDMARTFVVGEPTKLQQDRYQALLEGELAQLEHARAGNSAASLFDVAVQTVRKGAALPAYQRTHCGHGIGLRAHEYPTLHPANADVMLEPGMVFCVETPYYEIGWGGMMVEDTIVITEGAPEYLTRSDRSLRII